MGHLCCHLPNDVNDSGDNLHVCWTLATLFYTLHWRFQQARRQEMKRGGGVFSKEMKWGVFFCKKVDLSITE